MNVVVIILGSFFLFYIISIFFIFIFVYEFDFYCYMFIDKYSILLNGINLKVYM